MIQTLIALADGFEEIETVTVADILRRAGFRVVLSGLREGPVTGSRRVRVVAYSMLERESAQTTDLLVIPGGQPGVDHLREDTRMLDFVRAMDRQKKWIGAICAAPLVLRDAGILAGRRYTCYPGVERDIPDGRFQSERVVVDGRLVTSRGPGTAMEFSLKLVELLVGKDKAQELASMVLAPPVP